MSQAEKLYIVVSRRADGKREEEVAYLRTTGHPDEVGPGRYTGIRESAVHLPAHEAVRQAMVEQEHDAQHRASQTWMTTVEEV